MGYIVERANLIERLFRSIHLALARLPGALAVATLVTCAIFATATGIVGAVVTLMGLLAMPAMLKAGYSVRLAAGVDHRRRLPGHPDPAVGAADRLRRHRRRVGGAAVRRRVLPRPDAGRPVHRLRDPRREDQALAGAAAVRRGPLRAAAAADAEDHEPERHAARGGRPGRRAEGPPQPATCPPATWCASWRWCSCRCCCSCSSRSGATVPSPSPWRRRPPTRA